MSRMKKLLSAVLSVSLVTPFFAFPARAAIDAVTETSVVFIANYDDDKRFRGWGSGFFVDEGIVVTNKHVIDGGDWYVVYATDAEGAVDTSCKKNITRSDVKVNLEDDVAYMRVFLPCAHGALAFADDPEDGDPVWVLGYPYRGSLSKSMTLLTTSGSVTGESSLGWLRTDAALDVGNSGGPVVGEDGVVGVAVAKGIDANGDYVTGYFIQSTVIAQGLLYANDSRFAYTPGRMPQPRSAFSSSSSSRASSVSSAPSSSARSSVRSRPASSARSSSVASFKPISFEGRTCQRVEKWFAKSDAMKERVNGRLLRRFGFACP